MREEQRKKEGEMGDSGRGKKKFVTLVVALKGNEKKGGLNKSGMGQDKSGM